MSLLNHKVVLLTVLITNSVVGGHAFAIDFPREQMVAIYIFRLAENFQWANEAQISQYRIHLLERDSQVVYQLTRISQQKSLNGKPFTVSYSRGSQIPDDVHVVYVSPSSSRSYSSVFQQTRGKNILLISDGQKDKRKIMINLQDSEDNRLKFEINKANIINQNLAVKPEIILLGGTEIDVAKLYRDSQSLLEEKETELGMLENHRTELVAALNKAQIESLALEEKIKAQHIQFTAQQAENIALEEWIQMQQELLEKKEQAVQVEHQSLKKAIGESVHQQMLIDSQIATIAFQKKELDKLEGDVNSQTLALAQQMEEIANRQLILTEQGVKIDEQSSLLQHQYKIISSQKGGLLAMTVGVIILILLSIAIYRGYRDKKIANASLAHAAHELELTKEVAESANRAKSAFLANMSHELRTPLNAILGFSELLADDPTTPISHRRNLEVINSSGHHLLSMINDVLDLSKVEAGMVELEPEPAHLHELVDEVDAIMRGRAEQKKLTFISEIASNVPSCVLIDAAKFRQILINLIGNAVKFTDRGKVALRLEAMNNDSGTHLLINVQDNGTGIAPSMLENIFKPFVQSEGGGQKGTGLGLSISKQFVQLMGGTIDVESELGMGSTFKIVMPVQKLSTLEIVEQKRSDHIVGFADGEHVRRILVVEDIENNRLLLCQLLKKIGFDVVEAEDGEKAIVQFNALSPELIWMDMHMPVMDGFEATRQIRKLMGGDQVKILALTATALKDQQEQILAAGCDAVYYKPYKLEDILQAIGEHLSINYRYANSETSEKLRPIVHPLECKELLLLPPSLVENILRAARSLNQVELQMLIETITEDQKIAKDSLMALELNFQFDEIIRLCESALVSEPCQ